MGLCLLIFSADVEVLGRGGVKFIIGVGGSVISSVVLEISSEVFTVVFLFTGCKTSSVIIDVSTRRMRW